MSVRRLQRYLCRLETKVAWAYQRDRPTENEAGVRIGLPTAALTVLAEFRAAVHDAGVAATDMPAGGGAAGIGAVQEEAFRRLPAGPGWRCGLVAALQEAREADQGLAAAQGGQGAGITGAAAGAPAGVDPAAVLCGATFAWGQVSQNMPCSSRHALLLDLKRPHTDCHW